MQSRVGETVVQLSSKYWIVKERQTAKNLISKCARYARSVVCKNLNSDYQNSLHSQVLE